MRTIACSLHTHPTHTQDAVSILCRGWCFCESSVSNLVKDYDYVLDIGKFSDVGAALRDVISECTAQRAPPLTPADFRLALAEKAFTSKKADEQMVGDLYDATFKERMQGAEGLNYGNLQWGDAEVVTLSNVVASGALDKLTVRLRPNAMPYAHESWHAHSPDV